MLRVGLAAVLTCLLGGTLVAQTRLVFTDAFPTDLPATMTPTSLSVIGFNEATAEPDEPDHDGRPAQKSVWARFIAKESGLFRITYPMDSSNPPRVAVYTNDSLATLGRVTSISLGGYTNELRWEAVAGVTYSIALDWIRSRPGNPSIGFSKFFLRATPDRPLMLGETVTLEAVSTDPSLELGVVTFARRLAILGALGTFGPRANLALVSEAPWRITLTNEVGGYWQITALIGARESAPSFVTLRPPADDIADAVELPPDFAFIRQKRSMGVGSVEPGEYLPLTNSWFGIPTTIWWKWTPSFTAPLEVRSSPHGLWAAYEGDPKATLPLKAGFNSISFEAQAGRTYFLQMVVANAPVFDPSTIEFQRSILRLAVPPETPRDDSINPFNGKEPGYLVLASAVEIGVSTLLPGETFTDFRLNGAEPGRFTAAGLPVFDLILPPEGTVYSLTATNQAGVRVTAPKLFLAARPTNDLVSSATPWPTEGQEGINGLLATASPDDPAVLGGPNARSRWWMFLSPSEVTVELSAGSISSTPPPATLAVFRGLPGPASQPVGFAAGSGPGYRAQFDAVADQPHYISIALPGLYSLGTPLVHPFRWRNRPDRFAAGRQVEIELSPSAIAGAVVNSISFDGRTQTVQQAPPFTFTLSADTPGWKTLRVNYSLPDGWTRDMEHRVLVAVAGDDFADARLLFHPEPDRRLEVTADLAGSSLEVNEPNPFGNEAESVWFAWYPLRTGDYALSRLMGDQGRCAIFEGDQLAELVLVATNSPVLEPVRFRATAGTPYRIRISAPAPLAGLQTFALEQILENDAFKHPLTLDEQSSVTGWNPSAATAEDGEPAHGGQPASRSFWWSVTAPENGVTELELFGFLADGPAPRVGVYRGEQLPTLEAIPVIARREGGQLALRWRHVAGQRLSVAVDSETPFSISAPRFQSVEWNALPTRVKLGVPTLISVTDLSPGSGPIAVQFGIEGLGEDRFESGGDPLATVWTPGGVSGARRLLAHYRRGESPWKTVAAVVLISPTNDDFADAQALPWDPEAVSHLSAWPYGATREANEPDADIFPEGTAWWRWQAPFTGEFFLSKATTHRQAVSLFQGTALTNLVRLAHLGALEEGTSARFEAEAGQTLFFTTALSGSGWPAEVFLTARGTNDAFANRVRVPATGGRFQGSIHGSTLEEGEPAPGFAETGSVWFELVPAGDGFLTVLTQPLRGCLVYRGTRLDQLQPWDGQSGRMAWPFQIPVQAGIPLQIRVLGEAQAAPQSGHFVLTLAPASVRQNGANFHHERQPLADGILIENIVAPPSFWPEPFETGDLSLPDSTYSQWWSYTAARAGRLRVQAWITNETGEFLRLTQQLGERLQLMAVTQDGDGNFRVRGKANAGAPLLVEVAEGESFSIRLASLFGYYSVNLQATLEENVANPILSLVKLTPANGPETAAEFTFTSVPNQPYSAWSAELPAGPWTMEWQGTPGAGTTDVTLPVRANPAFFRVTSP